jgi:hypothetical protein
MRQAESYPMLAQVDEADERCFNFNIPMDDDAHMVFVVIPNEDYIEDKEESWYFEQVFKLTKLKTEVEGIPHKFPDEMPNNVAKHMSEYLQHQGGSNESPITVQLTVNPTSDQPHASKYMDRQRTKYFLPTVMHHVRRSVSIKSRNQGQGRKLTDDLVSYRVCLLNANPDEQAQVILDVVLLSEDIPDDEKESGFAKDKHLTPLELSLDHSIAAANVVIREMNYMQARELRMRETAENINTRVRWFSYLSVAVLLVVTYVQVTYLKRYFHKKKLM